MRLKTKTMQDPTREHPFIASFGGTRTMVSVEYDSRLHPRV